MRVYRGQAGGIQYEIHHWEGAWMGLRPSPAFLGTDTPPTGIARHYLENGEISPETVEIPEYRKVLVFHHDKGGVAWWDNGWVRAEGSHVIARINDKVLAGTTRDGRAKLEDFLNEGPEALTDLTIKVGLPSEGELHHQFLSALQRL